jgi:hypothetical protein
VLGEIPGPTFRRRAVARVNRPCVGASPKSGRRPIFSLLNPGSGKANSLLGYQNSLLRSFREFFSQSAVI